MISLTEHGTTQINLRETRYEIGKSFRIFQGQSGTETRTTIRTILKNNMAIGVSERINQLHQRSIDEGLIKIPCRISNSCDLVFNNIPENHLTESITLERIKDCIQNNIYAVTVYFEGEIYTIYKDVPQSQLLKKSLGLERLWSYVYKKYNLSVPERILKDIALTILLAGNGQEPFSSVEAYEEYYYDMMNVARLISFNAIATSSFRRMHEYKTSFITVMKKRKLKYDSIRI